LDSTMFHIRSRDSLQDLDSQRKSFDAS
jgi:hypothetical protein